jgi:hypothetical protein
MYFINNKNKSKNQVGKSISQMVLSLPSRTPGLKPDSV